MKKISFLIAFIALTIPLLSSAHERDVFQINGSYYQFVVGSQNEPVAIDDKTGVDFRVTKVAAPDSATGDPVNGLENALRVELQAAGAKRMQDFSAAYGQPGAYYSVFYPTTPDTVYTYRILGTLDNTPIDLTFTCHPGKHVMGGQADTSVVDVGNGVKRVSQIGMFSCPADNEALGFPVPSAHTAHLRDGLLELMASVGKLQYEMSFIMFAVGLLVIGFAFASRKR